MELRAEEATKRFGPFTAVDSVTFAVESGESIALHGPNGSGKTTLLRMLAGLSTPTSGSIRVNGADIYDRETRIHPSIGYLSHKSTMYDDLTAYENLRFHARLHDVDESRVTNVLETVDLLDRAGGFPREFSHGMNKRLSLARSLLADPDILLLDEPFTGLDQHSTETVKALIEERTVVLVTHDPETSTSLCNQFLVLKNGQMVHRFEDESVDATTFRSIYHEVLSS